jgi:hypothetical protein
VKAQRGGGEPVRCRETGKAFGSIRDAAIATGVVQRSVLKSIQTGQAINAYKAGGWFTFERIQKGTNMSEQLSEREIGNFERRILDAEKAKTDVRLDRRDAWMILAWLKGRERSKSAVAIDAGSGLGRTVTCRLDETR